MFQVGTITQAYDIQYDNLMIQANVDFDAIEIYSRSHVEYAGSRPSEGPPAALVKQLTLRLVEFVGEVRLEICVECLLEERISPCSHLASPVWISYGVYSSLLSVFGLLVTNNNFLKTSALDEKLNLTSPFKESVVCCGLVHGSSYCKDPVRVI